MNIAKKFLPLAYIMSLALPAPCRAAGIPVFDAANTAQSTVSAIEAVSQTMKQLEQYTLQLQQFEDQIRNSLAPATYIWSKAQGTMDQMLSLQDSARYYTQSGGLEAYLSRYKDVNFYRGGSMDGAMWRANDAFASESKKKAYDAQVRVLKQQQETLRKEAAILERLQGGAQSAKGRLEAIQYANMLAAKQNNQLMQIRALLIAQQEADNARHQAAADREAREQALVEKILKPEQRFEPSPKVGWKAF